MSAAALIFNKYTVVIAVAISRNITQANTDLTFEMLILATLLIRQLIVYFISLGETFFGLVFSRSICFF